mgnify:CR=1 FL=1
MPNQRWNRPRGRGKTNKRKRDDSQQRNQSSGRSITTNPKKAGEKMWYDISNNIAKSGYTLGQITVDQKTELAKHMNDAVNSCRQYLTSSERIRVGTLPFSKYTHPDVVQGYFKNIQTLFKHQMGQFDIELMINGLSKSKKMEARKAITNFWEDLNITGISASARNVILETRWKIVFGMFQRLLKTVCEKEFLDNFRFTRYRAEGDETPHGMWEVIIKEFENASAKNTHPLALVDVQIEHAQARFIASDPARTVEMYASIIQNVISTIRNEPNRVVTRIKKIFEGEHLAADELQELDVDPNAPPPGDEFGPYQQLLAAEINAIDEHDVHEVAFQKLQNAGFFPDSVMALWKQKGFVTRNTLGGVSTFRHFDIEKIRSVADNYQQDSVKKALENEVKDSIRLFLQYKSNSPDFSKPKKMKGNDKPKNSGKEVKGTRAKWKFDDSTTATAPDHGQTTVTVKMVDDNPWKRCATCNRLLSRKSHGNGPCPYRNFSCKECPGYHKPTQPHQCPEPHCRKYHRGKCHTPK